MENFRFLSSKKFKWALVIKRLSHNHNFQITRQDIKSLIVQLVDIFFSYSTAKYLSIKLIGTHWLTSRDIFKIPII